MLLENVDHTITSTLSPVSELARADRGTIHILMQPPHQQQVHDIFRPAAKGKGLNPAGVITINRGGSYISLVEGIAISIVDSIHAESLRAFFASPKQPERVLSEKL